MFSMQQCCRAQGRQGRRCVVVTRQRRRQRNAVTRRLVRKPEDQPRCLPGSDPCNCRFALAAHVLPIAALTPPAESRPVREAHAQGRVRCGATCLPAAKAETPVVRFGAAEGAGRRGRSCGSAMRAACSESSQQTKCEPRARGGTSISANAICIPSRKLSTPAVLRRVRDAVLCGDTYARISAVPRGQLYPGVARVCRCSADCRWPANMRARAPGVRGRPRVGSHARYAKI